jgi:hypothetical protein
MSKQTWTVEVLTDHYAGLGSVSGAHMQHVLDWAVANDRLVESEAKAPWFSVAGKTGERLFAVFSSGHVYVWLEDSRYPGGANERDRLASDLKDRDLMKSNFDVSAVKEGKTMSRKLGDLNEEELVGLLGLLDTYAV